MAGLSRDPAEVFEAAQGGHRLGLARLMSMVERGGDDARVLGALTFPQAGSAHTVGITGAPGSGKSTLTSALTAVVRGAGERMAVLAVDPSSPFTGGAILGDRVRMQDHVMDEDVYIRSMATRGHLGGLSLATPQAVRVLDALGWPWVLVETVGVGQVEVEIAGAADTTVVVVNPGWGDSVQANKAGLMEIADIFVINKSERAGADDTRRDIQQMLELSSLGSWEPPIVMTVGTTGAGTEELWAETARHREHITASGELERRRSARLETELQEILHRSIEARVALIAGGDDFGPLRDEVLARMIDPYAAVSKLLDSIEL
ncbi:MAG: methylmalonyl Co-A mutase-associated GTPase MeaB [Acidimicrobiales bacterium]